MIPMASSSPVIGVWLHDIFSQCSASSNEVDQDGTQDAQKEWETVDDLDPRSHGGLTIDVQWCMKCIDTVLVIVHCFYSN